MSDLYKDQWKNEKTIFFKGLKENKYLLLENSISVSYPGTENTNDPRYITYDFGDCRLHDDHFCSQYCSLSYKEISEILHKLKALGIDVEQYDIFYECTGFCDGQNY